MKNLMEITQTVVSDMKQYRLDCSDNFGERKML